MRARYIDILVGAASNYTLAISDDWPKQCVAPSFPIVLARGVARWVGPDTGAGKAFIDFFLGEESMSMLAKQGEFVNRNGVYPPIADSDKIQFVEMYDLDEKGFAEKKKEYSKIFLQ